jgi:hypothetical protein
MLDVHAIQQIGKSEVDDGKVLLRASQIND